jgi:exonuclease VII large subunit
MPMFVVNRYLPDLTAEQLGVLRRALSEAARRVSAEGQFVRYLRSTYVPARGRCVCVFTANTADAVARANEVAQVPFSAIDEAVEAPPASSG